MRRRRRRKASGPASSLLFTPSGRTTAVSNAASPTVRDGQAAHDGDVFDRQHPHTGPHPRPRTPPRPRRCRHVDSRRRAVEHPVPVRGGRPADGRGALTQPTPGRPEPRRPHPSLVGQPVAADQHDARMQALPAPLPDPPADAIGGVAARRCLHEGHHPGLARDQLLEGHRPSMSAAPVPRARLTKPTAMITGTGPFRAPTSGIARFRRSCDAAHDLWHVGGVAA